MFPPGVRLGAGSLVEDDVVLGAHAGRSRRSRDLEVGRNAIIRRGTAVHEGVRIGDRLETGRNVVIGADTKIGDDCRIWHNSVIESECTFGDRVKIQANCYVGSLATIEDDVTIESGVCLANDPHPGSRTHLCARGPTLARNSQVGMNATIFPFVTIGEGAMVEAGSVVTRSVPEGLVVGGNPARVLGSVAEIGCPLDLPEGGYLGSTPDGEGHQARTGDVPMRERRGSARA